MTNEQLNEWWSRLRVQEKVRVASKAASKLNGKIMVVSYPKCTFWWSDLAVENKQYIYDHLTNRHGIVLKDWTEGNMYSE